MGSSVSMVTRLRFRRRRNQNLIRITAGDLYVLQILQSGPRSYLSSYMGTDKLPREKRGRSMKLVTHFHLVLTLRLHGIVLMM